MRKSIGVLKHLPPELEYLIEPALKYGIYQEEDEKAEFLERATPEQLDELAKVAERIRVNEHKDLLDEFFDQYRIKDYKEAAKLYFLFGVMDTARLQFTPHDWNTVERHIKTLGKSGSFRMASKRAWAARFLADFGEAARLAIPHLRRALTDPDLRVQVWAHYALAVIEGNRAEHEAAVRHIFSEHQEPDEASEYPDFVGSEASEVLEMFANWEREGDR